MGMTTSIRTAVAVASCSSTASSSCPTYTITGRLLFGDLPSGRCPLHYLCLCLPRAADSVVTVLLSCYTTRFQAAMNKTPDRQAGVSPHISFEDICQEI